MGQKVDKDTSPLVARRVAKFFPCLSMGSGIHEERATIFCMCAIFDNASPYTRSKFSNNHRLYRDTMPFTVTRHWRKNQGGWGGRAPLIFILLYKPGGGACHNGFGPPGPNFIKNLDP